MKLSAIIITKDEEDNITACLESVKWADEIVVVDTGSKDRTVDLCRKYTDKIFFSPPSQKAPYSCMEMNAKKLSAFGACLPVRQGFCYGDVAAETSGVINSVGGAPQWLGFGQLKNFAVQKTTGDWILNIDADERVGEGLREEIRKIISAPSHFDGFYIRFHFYFMGHRMRYGGQGSEKHLRLFRKDKGRFQNDAVHEAVVVTGAVGKLRGHIEHRSYRNLKEYFEKFNFYTTLTAEEKHRKSEKFYVFNLFRIPFEIFGSFVLKLGFLDGIYGFVYAVLSAFYVWVKYVKLWEIEKSVKK